MELLRLAVQLGLIGVLCCCGDDGSGDSQMDPDTNVDGSDASMEAGPAAMAEDAGQVADDAGVDAAVGMDASQVVNMMSDLDAGSDEDAGFEGPICCVEQSSIFQGGTGGCTGILYGWYNDSCAAITVCIDDPPEGLFPTEGDCTNAKCGRTECQD